MAKKKSKKFDLLGSAQGKCKTKREYPGYIIYENCEFNTENPRIKNIKIKSLFIWK